MTKSVSTHKSSRSPASLLLSKADWHASRPMTAAFVATVAGTWLIVSIAAGFPAQWEIVFDTVVSAVTLAMVFIIQHTQARHQLATQRKLDEILLAMPGTDNALVTLEHASDDELHSVGHQHLASRHAALEERSADRVSGPTESS